MSTTQPIRNLEDLESLKNYFLVQKPNLRNYALICTAVNTARRISDVLSLKWDDVYHMESNTFRTHLVLTEQKTKKNTMIALNHGAVEGLSIYLKSLPSIEKDQYIFVGKDKKKPISRIQAYRIIKEACEALNLSDHISCHSLRKTFGYQAWVSGTNPALLVSIYNHSSFDVTKRYLGIEQDDKDKVFLNLDL